MKKKDEENCRIGKAIAGSEMKEKKRRGMKSRNKRKGEKCQELLRKYHNCVIGILRGREELGRRKRNEKGGKQEKG